MQSVSDTKKKEGKYHLIEETHAMRKYIDKNIILLMLVSNIALNFCLLRIKLYQMRGCVNSKINQFES